MRLYNYQNHLKIIKYSKLNIMGKIVEIQTEYVLTIKLLFEVLKEILNDVTIEVIRDPVNTMTQAVDEYQDDEDENKQNDIQDEEEQVKEDKIEDKIEDKNNEDDEQPKKGKKAGKKDKKNKKQKEEVKQDEPKQESSKQIQKKEDDDSKCGGLKIMTVDPSKTLLIQVKLDSKKFSSVFKCRPPSYDICVSLVQLYKLLKSLEKDDILTISVDDDDEQHVVLKVDNQEKNCESTYRLKMMDLDKKTYKIPPIAVDAVITLDAVEFHKICREMNNIAEFVEIKVTPNSLTYSCKGDTAERSTTYYLGENGIKIKFTNNKNTIIQGIFELKYLVLFTKCANLCSNMNIQIFMKNSYPLCIRYTVATLGKILLCLAPVDETHIKGSFSDDEEIYEDEETKPKLKNT